jgi:hypothetical protein
MGSPFIAKQTFLMQKDKTVNNHRFKQKYIESQKLFFLPGKRTVLKYHIQQQRLCNSKALLTGPGRKAGRSSENGIDRRQGGIEAIEVNDGSSRKRAGPDEIFRAEIDRFRLFPIGEERKAMSAADYWSGSIEKTAPIFEKGACVSGSCASQLPDARALIFGKLAKPHGQGCRFHRKDGDMSAAVIATLPAGQAIHVFPCDSAAQRIDPGRQIAVVMQLCRVVYHSVTDLENFLHIPEPHAGL